MKKEEKKIPFDMKAFLKKTLLSFVGIFFMGFFLSFLVQVNYGTDPYTFMNLSLCKRLGWSLGNWQLILNAAFLLFVILLNRRLIGPGTIFNMVLIGYYVDLFTWLWKKLFPDTLFTAQPSRALIFAVCLIGFVIAAAVYMNADAGLSPYDASCRIIADLLIRRIPKLPFFIIRICCDALVVLTGLLAGGIPTIGIIAMTLLLGPAITLVGRVMRRFTKH
ncbi:MAG: hypothetical protein IK115_01395 [Lachnospiraceae bacterium]|nr:hypothetical protein [Lachnospiraceae bacterium]